MKKGKDFALKRGLLTAGVAILISGAALVGCASQDAQDATSAGEEEMVATVDFHPEGDYREEIAALPAAINNDLDAESALQYAPKTYTNKDGFLVQPTPDDGTGWNNIYLDADNRGCTSCHTLEDALMALPTYHGFIFEGYPTEQTFSQCVACHIYANPLQDSMHTLHNNSELFANQGGSCDSCHYVTPEGDYLRWDYEKYKVMHGITTLDAETADVEVSYDQTTITTPEQMFFKSIKQYGEEYDPIDWRTDDANMDPELYNNWVFTVGGEVENPISMTLPELVEKFGTVTTTMKQQCCINGYGNATIYNCEVTGVSMKDIIDYVKPKAGVNAVDVETEDPYPGTDHNYHFPFEAANVEDCVLVTEVSGQTLPNSQGFPCSLWVPRSSAALNYKVCMGVDFIETTEEDAVTGYFLAGFEDDYNGEIRSADKPNSAVLNYPTGVVLEGQAGQPVQIEGYADAFDEPIKLVEFSFDKGETWTEMPTPNNDPTCWTYWRMNFTPPEPGSYLLTIRTTSIQPDGTDRVNGYDTEFLLNVR